MSDRIIQKIEEQKLNNKVEKTNKKEKVKKYSLGEEIFSSVVHGIGSLLSIAALVLLIIFTAKHNGTALDIIGVIIYGITLILLYTMSTLYHSISNEKAKNVLQVFDHCSIYFLIAGTFTPLTFTMLKDTGKITWIVFSFVWLMAILGTILYAIFPRRFKALNVSSYALMGWSALFLIPSLISKLSAINCMASVYLLVIGGIAYTLGIVFYALKKVKYFHSIFHIFVLAGSVCHFFCILLYTLKI